MKYSNKTKFKKLLISTTYLGINFSRVILILLSYFFAKHFLNTDLAHLALILGIFSIIYLLLELLLDLTNRTPSFSYFVTGIDLSIIYYLVFATGMNSFFLGGIIYTTAITAQNSKIKQGFFSVIFSFLLHSTLLGLIYSKQIEYYNIFQPNEKPNFFNLLIGLSLTSLVNALVYSVIIQMQNKLRSQKIQLEIERNKLEISYNLLTSDLVVAREIQKKLIPQSSPHPDIHTLYHPMMHVGGDYFDFLRFRNPDLIGIFLSDVSGHGVPAAFITAMIKSTLLQSGVKKENPSDLLNYLNEVLFNQTGGYFITAFYAIYDTSKNSLTYANAGHPWPFYLKDSKLLNLSGKRGSPIGIFSNQELETRNKNYGNSTVHLYPKTRILFFTDGLTETRSIRSDDSFFEDKALPDLLRRLENTKGTSFITELFKELKIFRGSDHFEDDVCVISLDSN